MFPNDVMRQPATWNHILAAMLAVRDAHGWSDRPAANGQSPRKASAKLEVRSSKKKTAKAKKTVKKSGPATRAKAKPAKRSKIKKAVAKARRPAAKKKARR